MKGILIASVLAGAGGVAAAQPSTVTTTTTTTTTVTFDPPAMTPSETPPRAPSPATVAPTVAPADRAFRLAVATGVARGFDTKDDCESACVGVDARIGVAIRARLFAIVGVSYVASPDDGKDAHHVETVALQYWPRARLWLEGGLGVGTPRTAEYGEPMSTEPRPAISLAIGYEAIALAHQSLGAQLRFASSIADLHHTAYLALLVGATFN